MKQLTINECGFSYFGGFGCGSDLSPRTMDVIYGSKSTVKKRMKKEIETTKKTFNQTAARSIWQNLYEIYWNIGNIITSYRDLILEIDKKIKTCKNKEKVNVGKKAIAEMKRRIPILKKIHDEMNDINQVEIAIPYENGNKYFVI